MFQTNYNHDICSPVCVSEELITEQTGYRTTKEIVEGMILAGQRLSDYRHGLLDSFAEEYDESQEAGLIYDKDPVDLQSAVESRVMRYRAQNQEVTDNEETQEAKKSHTKPKKNESKESSEVSTEESSEPFEEPS